MGDLRNDKACNRNLAAAGVALSVPASAQGVWIGAGPVGVVLALARATAITTVRLRCPRYRSYADDDGYSYRRHCRVVRQNFNGYVRKVRRRRQGTQIERVPSSVSSVWGKRLRKVRVPQPFLRRVYAPS